MLQDNPCWVVTPLLANRWEQVLAEARLLHNHHDMVYSILHSFDTGARLVLLSSYIPSNHSLATSNPSEVDLYISTKLQAGHC
jgi:hypothetical protein